MTSVELEYAEKRMRQKWYDLVMAEQKGASVQELERMCNAYILAVEEYNRCSAQQNEAQEQPTPTQPQRAAISASTGHSISSKRRRKAS